MAKQTLVIVVGANGIKLRGLPDSDPLCLTFGPSISPQAPQFGLLLLVVCPLRKLPNVGCAGHKCMGCKQQSLLGPALHDKSRVHPRNFHNLHLNICLEHHGMVGKEEMQLFFVPRKDWKMKNHFNYPPKLVWQVNCVSWFQEEKRSIHNTSIPHKGGTFLAFA